MIEPRGIRHNNPGNIEYQSRNRWQGQLPHDPSVEPRFARFDTPQNGIRAMARLLLTYGARYNLRTVEAIIGRWAPRVENDTQGYIAAVERQLVQREIAAPGGELELQDITVLTVLVQAIMVHENGRYPYRDEVVVEGVRRALVE